MCSFEEPTGLCGWAQDDDDELDWDLAQGETSSYMTGPKRDHTLGLPSGHFIHLEASFPSIEGDRARIASPVLNSTGSCSFRFYYHMYGEVSFATIRIIGGRKTTYVRSCTLAHRYTEHLQPNNVWWSSESTLLEERRNR